VTSRETGASAVVCKGPGSTGAAALSDNVIRHANPVARLGMATPGGGPVSANLTRFYD